MKTIEIFPNIETLSKAVADRLLKHAQEAYEKSHPFNIALSGGSTPERLYETLATPYYVDQIPWPGLGLFFGDERTVPPDDENSNYRMAHHALFSKVPIPQDHIHRIKGEDEPSQAANDYADVIARHVKQKEGLPIFDLVLLGLGTDGHIASLFPDTPILNEKEKWVEAVYVEKLSTWRISLTLPVINNAERIWLLVSGKSKQTILCDILGSAATQDVRYPVQLLTPSNEIVWFLDHEAAAKLPSQ